MVTASYLILPRIRSIDYIIRNQLVYHNRYIGIDEAGVEGYQSLFLRHAR